LAFSFDLNKSFDKVAVLWKKVDRFETFGIPCLNYAFIDLKVLP